MRNYNGLNANSSGIHRPLTRIALAAILRATRKVDRQDARDYMGWLAWLGTYPCKPIDDTWHSRMVNKSRAFLKRYNEDHPEVF